VPGSLWQLCSGQHTSIATFPRISNNILASLFRSPKSNWNFAQGYQQLIATLIRGTKTILTTLLSGTKISLATLGAPRTSWATCSGATKPQCQLSYGISIFFVTLLKEPQHLIATSLRAPKRIINFAEGHQHHINNFAQSQQHNISNFAQGGPKYLIATLLRVNIHRQPFSGVTKP